MLLKRSVKHPFIIIHATPLKNDSFMVRCGKMSEKYLKV